MCTCSFFTHTLEKERFGIFRMRSSFFFVQLLRSSFFSFLLCLRANVIALRMLVGACCKESTQFFLAQVESFTFFLYYGRTESQYAKGEESRVRTCVRVCDVRSTKFTTPLSCGILCAPLRANTVVRLLRCRLPFMWCMLVFQYRVYKKYISYKVNFIQNIPNRYLSMMRRREREREKKYNKQHSVWCRRTHACAHVPNQMQFKKKY